MGLFDRMMGRPSQPSPQDPLPAPANAAGEPAVPSVAPVGAETIGVRSRLVAARQKLDAKDLPGALALYEEMLATAGDRADVLVTVSGDLGATGHVASIIELVAPRYDAVRHGPATGLNLIQAYLAVRDPEAARHVLDILFALNRPELEDRLHGLSNAIAELLANGAVVGLPDVAPLQQAPNQTVKIALITISKPIWSYGLESLGEEILPETGRPRRIAFAQLALLPATDDPTAAPPAAGHPLMILATGLPLWFAESFYFSPLYAPVAAVALADDPDAGRKPMVFPAEWGLDNLRQLVDSTQGGLDYIFTGAAREQAGTTEVLLRVWEVRKFRERKQFTVRFTAETADTELSALHDQVRAFMEWAPFPAGTGLTYAPPPAPGTWLQALDLSLALFLAEKAVLPTALVPPLSPVFDAFAPHAFSPPSASLTWLTLRSRAAALGISPPLAEIMLNSHPAVGRARAALGL